MEGRSLIYRYLKGHTYPLQGSILKLLLRYGYLEYMSLLLGFFPTAYLFPSPSVGPDDSGWVDAYRYRCLQAFFLTVYLFPPLCFSDQNNWLQELTVFPYFLFNTVETRLPPYHFPALPHLTISHALFPQSLCYGNSGFLLLIHMCLNKYWHRSLHFPFWANN